MIYSKQLYQTNTFNLPQIGTISLNPFPIKPIQLLPHPQRDQALNKIFANKQIEFKAYCSAYLSEFQQLCAKENLYPFMLASSNTKLAIVCRQCIVLCDWHFNEKGKIYQGGGQIIKIDKIQKVKITQVPTALCIGKNSLFVGYQSGRISQYLFRTKSWEGACDDLQFPIMQLQAVRQQQNKESSVIALDSAGNIGFITFSHKTFMDKIIKTLTSLKWISFEFRNKKREKIKKMFQTFINKEKDASDTQSSSSQAFPQQVTYFYNKFHLRKLNNEIMLTVFRKNKLQILILNQNYQLSKTLQVECEHFKQKNDGIAFVELGEGGFQNSNIRHNILVVGLSTCVLFYRLLQIEDSYQVLLVSEVQNERNLLFGSFISNSLLIVGTKQSIGLQNISEKQKSIINYDHNKFSYVDFFIDEEKMQMDRKLLFRYIFSVLSRKGDGKDERFICLQGKRLIVGSIFSWESILYQQIQSQRWERALLCSQQIYNSKYRLCCGINEDGGVRNSQMNSVFKVIVMGYLHNKLSVLKDKGQQCCYIINNTIYFLLKCDQPQMLFNEIQTFFCLNELSQIFIGQLSHYIQETNGYKLKIPYLSEKLLNKIIAKYKSSHQEYILERLFMNFDLFQMQKLMLLTTCLRQQLYQSLIYICCEQRDYITPIIKLCGIKLTNPEKHARIAEVIYWYLSQCLHGRMTDYGNEADYINMLAILINFMFIPSSLQMLLQTSHVFLIQIINMFFEPRILRHILENQQQFFMRRGQEGDKIFQESSLRQYRLYQKMLSILIRVIQSSPQQERQLYELELNKFLTSIMVKNQFPFLSTIKIKIILFYIHHPFIFINKEQNITEDNQVYMNGHLMRLLDSLLRSITDKCQKIREQTKQDVQASGEIQELMRKSKQIQLSKILQAIILSQYNMQFSQTKCYIYHELGNYSEVMETYLKMTNKKIRLKIYQYLENNMGQYYKLTQQFLKYMISLLNLQEKKTQNLIEKLREDWVQHEEIIDKLVGYPTIQLNYIEKVIHKQDKTKKLLLRHLEIVLREKPEQVELFINKIDYPLEEAFRMCQESNNKKGKAFILIKSGRNMQGVLIIAEIFLELIQEYLRGLFKKIQYEKQKKDNIMSQLQVVLNTCHKQWNIDNQRGEEIWQKITELIFKKLNVNNIDSPHIPQSIKNILNQIITQLLSTMLEQVSTDFFLNRFARTFASIPLRIFIQAHKYIYQRMQFTFTLQKLNKDLLQQGQIQTWKSIMQSIYQGHICYQTCNICNNSITINERMVTYHCNHIFHQQCYYEYNNKKNRNQLCPLCFNSIDSYMICSNQNKIPRYRLEVDEQELLKHKINKMSYYDRNALLQNWDQYQYWVDI